MSASIPRRARYLTVAGLATLGLAVVAQFAVSTTVTAADPYTAPLHQSPPIKNSEFDDDEGDCPGSPAMWGWHFILPGNDASFVSLTATFQTAGTITKTSGFGPPTTKHAYLYTATDDTLLGASAQVVGGDPDKVRLVLSHTCDGGGTQPTSSPTPSPTGTPTPTETVSPTETGTPTPTETVSPTETGTPTPTETVSPTETGTPTPTETVSPTETGTPTPTETVSPTETGTPTPTETVSPTETGTPTPTETVSPTETGTPTPSETVSPTETGTPTDTGTPSPTVSGTQLTQTPSGSVSVSPTVRGVRQTRGPDVGGNTGNTGALPTTGTTVPVGLLVLLGFALIGAGVVTTVRSEVQPVPAGGKHRS